MQDKDAAGLLRRMLDAAIAAADPAAVLARFLPEKPAGRCIVVGAGKSAAAMARAVEAAWPDVELSGVVVTRYGHAVPTRRITVREAAHPVPDEAGCRAAAEILRAAGSAGPGDLVLALISGGGSALMTLPVAPLTLADKAQVNRLLLGSGLGIGDMNRVRRRLSRIKGGGLARAAGGARLVTLAISDVPGDDPAAIASGPTVPDPSAGDDLSHLVARLGPDLPPAAREILLRPTLPVGSGAAAGAAAASASSSGPASESAPAPASSWASSGGPGSGPESGPDTSTESAPASVPVPASEPGGAGRPDYRLIATPQTSLLAAAEVALAAGITPLILGDALEGEAAQLGLVMAGIARACAAHGTPARPPAVLLSGGETTVTLASAGAGRGGRNTEFLLSLALGLDGHAGIHALAADTDGIDGTEAAAGALIGPDTLARARAAGQDPRACLASHDSHTLFERTGSLVVTGPTLTNVNDFRAVLVL